MRASFGDAWRAIVRRPQRSALTSLGVLLGVGALVAIIGVASSASVQIASRFDAFAATAIVISLPNPAGRDAPEVDERLRGIPGVLASGFFTELSDVEAGLQMRSLSEPEPQPAAGIVASVDGLLASVPIVREGSLPSAWQWQEDPSLVVLGDVLAREMGVSPEAGKNVLDLNGRPHIVAAVIGDRGIRSQLSLSVVMSPRAADLLEIPYHPKWLLRVDRGTGASVAEAAPLALDPRSPSDVLVEVPPDPVALRGRLSRDAQGLFVTLSLVTLLVGTAGIANTMLVSVLERQAEIGLRRAMGASRRAIASLFLMESSLLGTVGGVMGAAGGVLVAAALVSARGWRFSLPAGVLFAPLLGLLVGIVAGAYPAFRSTRISPAEVLRGGV